MGNPAHFATSASGATHLRPRPSHWRGSCRRRPGGMLDVGHNQPQAPRLADRRCTRRGLWRDIAEPDPHADCPDRRSRRGESTSGHHSDSRCVSHRGSSAGAAGDPLLPGSHIDAPIRPHPRGNAPGGPDAGRDASANRGRDCVRRPPQWRCGSEPRRAHSPLGRGPGRSRSREVGLARCRRARAVPDPWRQHPAPARREGRYDVDRRARRTWASSRRVAGRAAGSVLRLPSELERGARLPRLHRERWNRRGRRDPDARSGQPSLSDGPRRGRPRFEGRGGWLALRRGWVELEACGR